MYSPASKKILVTGATGFVGSHLARKLVGLGCDVAITKRSNSNTWRINDIINKLQTIDVDLCDAERLKTEVNKLRPQLVFHLATYGNFSNETNACKIIDVNINGTLNLIESLLNCNIELFINTGSSSEYGDYESPMSESLSLKPLNIYGAAKATTTLLCNTFHKIHDFPVATLRPFSPYGPFDHQSRLIPFVILSGLKGDGINLTGGEQERDYIFIDDVIDAYIKTAVAQNIAGRVINVGSGKGQKIRDIVNNINKLLDRSAKINWDAIPYRDGEIFKWSSDIRLARELLGWSPATKIEDGLKKTCEWFKDHL